ncbi:MAG: ATP-binding protein [Planctomycetota bacterium]
MTANRARILIAEDEALIAEDLRAQLEELGHDVVAIVDRAEDVLATALDTTPDLVLLDIKLKGRMDGITAGERLGALRALPFVFVTSYADAATIERACNTSPFGYLVKPFDERSLQATVQAALSRHRAEGTLRSTKDWFGSILHSIGDAVVVTDADERITYLNPVGERMSRWPLQAAVGQRFADVFRLVEGDANQPLPSVVGTAMREQRIVQVRRGTGLLARDGSMTQIEDSVAPMRSGIGDDIAGAVVVLRDCSEEVRLSRDNERLQQQIAEVQRLQQMGKVVQGLAHDFNNALTTALGGLELCRLDAAPGSQMASTLETVERTLQQVAGLCRRMQQSAAPDRLRLEAVDLAALVRDGVEAVQIQAGERVAFDLDLQDVPAVRADRLQLHRVLTNVLLNAVDAFGPGDGRVAIRLHPCEAPSPDADDVVLSPAATTVPHACLEIGDDGCGMDPAVRQRMFEPLFSTKGNGRGLGLAGAMAILRAHGAGLRVRSRPGAGSVFTMVLPLA